MTVALFLLSHDISLDLLLRDVAECVEPEALAVFRILAMLFTSETVLVSD